MPAVEKARPRRAVSFAPREPYNLRPKKPVSYVEPDSEDEDEEDEGEDRRPTPLNTVMY